MCLLDFADSATQCIRDWRRIVFLLLSLVKYALSEAVCRTFACAIHPCHRNPRAPPGARHPALFSVRDGCGSRAAGQSCSVARRPNRRGELDRLVSARAGRPSDLHAPEPCGGGRRGWLRRRAFARQHRDTGCIAHQSWEPAEPPIRRTSSRPAHRLAVRAREGSKVARSSPPQRADVPSFTADQQAHVACPGWQEPGRPDGDEAPDWHRARSGTDHPGNPPPRAAS